MLLVLRTQDDNKTNKTHCIPLCAWYNDCDIISLASFCGFELMRPMSQDIDQDRGQYQVTRDRMSIIIDLFLFEAITITLYENLIRQAIRHNFL